MKTRTDAEIVAQTNNLAREFYSTMGNKVRAGYDFANATHPQERLCWNLASLAQLELTETDVANAMDEMAAMPIVKPTVIRKAKKS